MASLESFLPIIHVIGLALALGGATVKLTLLLKCRADLTFLPVYFATVKPITRSIVVGTVLLVLSGIGWLLLGYPLTPVLIVKLVMVGVILVLGPTIDNLVEPQFQNCAPGPGELASPRFLRIQTRYLIIEATATGIFYVIVVMWMLR